MVLPRKMPEEEEREWIGEKSRAIILFMFMYKFTFR